MSRPKNDPESLLNRAIEAIRNDVPGPEIVARARERVWSRLAADADAGVVDPASIETIRTCDDVRALLPGLVAGTLPDARAILVEDHTRECLPCRRALLEVRAGRQGARPAATADRDRTGGFRIGRFALAAAAAGLAVLSGYAAWRYLPADPARAAVRVEAVDGALFRVTGNWSSSAAVGEEIPGGQVFRTAKGSRAVIRLADDSRVEMNERSELSVSARRVGTTLHLARGSVIVEAAPQGAGRLFVDSTDCRVAVTGTIFSVNHGTKGSRVSVIEGEVRVRLSGAEKILGPGDQLATHRSLSTVPVADEIAWSRHVDRHLAVLAELTQLRRDIERLPHPELRHDTGLLDLAPANTVVYAAVPNIGGNLAEAHRLLRERLEASPALRQWWDENLGSPGREDALRDALEQLRAFGDQIGEELVIAVEIGAPPAAPKFLALAELTRPSEFLPFLEERLGAATGEPRPNVRIVTDIAGLQDDGSDDLLVWVREGILVASNAADSLRALDAAASGRAPSGFVGSPFHTALARTYEEGTTWLLGIDVQRALRAAASEAEHDASVLDASGLLDARHLIVEGREMDGRTEYQAILSFDQPRRGVASWLAAPAPMGALDFVSPDATMAAAFVAKNPAALTEDLLGILDREEEGFRSRLAEFEATHGVSFSRDLAATLGGEFAVALDGPVLPKPSWKLVVEVYDAERLQATLDWAVSEINRTAEDDAPLGLRLEAEQVGDRRWYRIVSDRYPIEVHYAFVDGYLIAGPSRSLIEDAAVRRASGLGLTASSRFQDLLPRDGRANFSALAYQNLAPVLGPVVARAVGGDASRGATDNRLLTALGGGLEPSLVYAYGEEDRIVAASTRPGGLLGSDLQMLLGLRGLFGAHGHLEAPPEADPAP